MTIYTGNLDGLAGTLTTMLDSRLVDLGWTIEQTGTNKRVYRNAAGASSRMFLRVMDDGTNTAGAKEALVFGGRSASDVDTLTDKFPTSAQLTNGVVWRKSNTATSATRPYLLAGDSRSFYLFVVNGDTGATVAYEMVGGAGDFKSGFSGDVAQAIVIGRPTENSATLAAVATQLVLMSNNTTTGFGVASATGYTSRYIGGAHDAASGSLPCQFTGNGQTYAANNALLIMPTLGGLAPTTTTELSEITLHTSAGGSLWLPRGSLRGLFIPCHDPAALNDGDTATGAGAESARTFRIVKGVQSSRGDITSFLATAGCVAIETSTVA